MPTKPLPVTLSAANAENALARSIYATRPNVAGHALSRIMDIHAAAVSRVNNLAAKSVYDHSAKLAARLASAETLAASTAVQIQELHAIGVRPTLSARYSEVKRNAAQASNVARATLAYEEARIMAEEAQAFTDRMLAAFGTPSVYGAAYGRGELLAASIV